MLFIVCIDNVGWRPVITLNDTHWPICDICLVPELFCCNYDLDVVSRIGIFQSPIDPKWLFTIHSHYKGNGCKMMMSHKQYLSTCFMAQNLGRIREHQKHFMRTRTVRWAFIGMNGASSSSSCIHTETKLWGLECSMNVISRNTVLGDLSFFNKEDTIY